MQTDLSIPLQIPSPSQGVWHLGGLPFRGYALCIIAGVIFAIWFGQRRWTARGGKPNQVADIAIWAVPFGLIGGRLYHVATDSGLYFGPGKDPWAAFYVWRGGLGTWGAVALGAVGAYIGCRRSGIKFLPFADALAPAVVVAQAIGRWGNWFNQELFGKPTTPLGPAHRSYEPSDRVRVILHVSSHLPLRVRLESRGRRLGPVG